MAELGDVRPAMSVVVLSSHSPNGLSLVHLNLLVVVFTSCNSVHYASYHAMHSVICTHTRSPLVFIGVSNITLSLTTHRAALF